MNVHLRFCVEILVVTLFERWRVIFSDGELSRRSNATGSSYRSIEEGGAEPAACCCHDRCTRFEHPLGAEECANISARVDRRWTALHHAVWKHGGDSVRRVNEASKEAVHSTDPFETVSAQQVASRSASRSTLAHHPFCWTLFEKHSVRQASLRRHVS